MILFMFTWRGHIMHTGRCSSASPESPTSNQRGHWANCSLRVVRPELVAQVAAAHGAGLWSCFCDIVNVAPDQCSAAARDAATLPLCLGGLGLRSASLTSTPAYWASWADSLHMIRQQHPGVADRFVAGLEGGVRTPALGSAVDAARHWG